MPAIPAVNISPYMQPDPTSAPPVFNGSTLTMNMVENPSPNSLNSYFVQVYFPPPKPNMGTPSVSQVTITAKDPHNPNATFGSSYTSGAGFANPSYGIPPVPNGSVEMAFRIIKSQGQSWPSPIQIQIQITALGTAERPKG
jgi:hypothetical protein